MSECTAEASDWKAGWLGVVKAANERELSFDRVEMASVWDVNAAWSPATSLDGHTQCRFCGEYVRDNGAVDMHECRGVSDDAISEKPGVDCKSFFQYFCHSMRSEVTEKVKSLG